MRPNVEHWLAHHMHPDFAGVLAPTWFMCIGIAGLVSLAFMLILARRRGMETGTVASAVLWGYLAAVLAGIVVPMTIDAILRVVETGHVQFRWAGMTSFWGYLAGAAAITIVCKRDELPLARMADLVAMPIGVALGFARLGCFMAGCDYGKVTSLPWAVRFPAGSPAWRDQLHAGLIPQGRLESLPVHPTQLYEAALGLVIIAVAYVVGRRRKEGHAFLAAAATYAIGRLVIEMLRGDAGRGVYAGLSSGQIFSLLVLLAIAMRFAVTKRLATVAASITLIGALATNADADDDDDHHAMEDYSKHVPSEPPPTHSDDAPPPVTDVTDVTDVGDGPPFVPRPTLQPLVEAPPPDVDRPLRPIYAIGILLGDATTLNRRGNQVGDLSGTTLSLAFLPGRFGGWLDLDHFSNSDATHTSLTTGVSFIPRVTPHLWIGGRAGFGFTEIDFMDSRFAGVAATDFRLEASAEWVMAHNWVLWFRPLSIDVISSKDIGGSITTLQFRAGIAYRFGERAQPAPPPPPPPAPRPTFEGQ